MRLEASCRLASLDGTRVTVPVAVGVIVKVCAVEEFENVRVIGVLNPPPDGVIVIVPEIAWPGVTVKTLDATPTVPLAGPVKV